MVGARPSGTVTFLFTDIEGSTRLWEERPDQMRDALAEHDERVRSAIERNAGYVFATGGDGFAAAFHTPDAALAAAVEAQDRVSAGSLAGLDLKVRMGIHAGTADERDGDYFGEAPTRAARIMSAAWGGQVLCSGVVAQMAINGASFTDLGEHQLRDLSAPLALCQVPSPGGSQFPAIRSLNDSPGNLPQDLSSLIGREELIEPLVERTRSERLVTLTGVGGVGKTSLALRIAAERSPDVRDGCWVMELAPLRTGDDVATAVLAALRLPVRPGLTPLESIVDGLKVQERLVVLDNCEHLLSACRELANSLLGACPDVRLVATSREGLGMPGEWTIAVPSLDVELAGTAEIGPAVELFLERARRHSSWEPAETDIPVIRDICRRLDGIPLAIELAAGRIGVLSPAELTSHLDDRFRLLGGSRGAAIERHQTLRAAVEWSYGLLDQRERGVFAALGVFAGSFDLEAAAFVAGEDRDILDTVEILDSLSRQSLLTVERSRSESRYRLLETLRQFAIEQLGEAGTASSVRRRHAEYHAGEVQRLAGELRGPREITALAALGSLMSDIRTALAFAVDQRDGLLAARLIGPLHNTTVQTRHEVTSLASTTVLDLAGRSGPWGPAVIVLNAWDAYLSSDPEMRAAALLRLLDAKHASDPVIASEAFRVAGALEALEGGAAMHEAEESYRIAAEAGDAYQQLNALVAWAAWEAAFGSPRPDLANRALEDARGLGNPGMVGWSTFIAAYAVERTDPDRALEIVEAGAALFGDREENSATSAYSVAGRILLRRGEYRRSLEVLQCVLSTNRRDNLRPEFSYSATAAAGSLAALGAATEAAIIHAALKGCSPWVNQLEAEELVSAIINGRLDPASRDQLSLEGERLSFEDAAELTMTSIEAVLASSAGEANGDGQ